MFFNLSRADLSIVLLIAPLCGACVACGLCVRYRNGEPWDWEPPFPHTPTAILAELATQADPDFVPPADPIVAIRDGDVQKAVAQEALTIVAFIEPGTKATTQLLPELVKAGRVLSRKGMTNSAGVPRPPAKLMTLDATAHPTAGEEFGVKKLPWMLLFESGASVGDVGLRRVACSTLL